MWRRITESMCTLVANSGSISGQNFPYVDYRDRVNLGKPMLIRNRSNSHKTSPHIKPKLYQNYPELVLICLELPLD